MTIKNKSHINENISDTKIEDSYGIDYLTWKNWGSESSCFGKLTTADAAYYSAELKRSSTSFPPNCKVLEIGFGNGSFLTYAKVKLWDIFGVEINKDLVTAAIKNNFNVIHSDNLISYNDDFFDLIVAFDVLEHIPQKDLTLFINEVKRILKKGGVFVARFPNGDSPFGLMNQNGDITHVTTLGSGKVHYFAAQCGMDVVFIGGEAQPLFVKSPLHFSHRLISLPIKFILNMITKLLFFPRTKISFYSHNLTLIYKKPN